MPGTSMTATMSSQFFVPRLPTLSTEKPVPSWQAASAAAIFMGCCSNMKWRGGRR